MGGGHFTGNVKFPNTTLFVLSNMIFHTYMQLSELLTHPHLLFLLDKWIESLASVSTLL